MSHTITREELLRRILSKSRPAIVEALPEKYYADKHLPGAVNMPHDQVDALASELLPNKDIEIVVYCANVQCRNSHIAAHRLGALGYVNVSVYREGKQDWEAANLPFESGTDVEASHAVAA
jgi:rhodanese-related sulfurtransferase